jgi:hypothetical protein
MKNSFTKPENIYQKMSFGLNFSMISEFKMNFSKIIYYNRWQLKLNDLLFCTLDDLN